MSNLGTKLCHQLVFKLMNNLGARLDIAQQKYTRVEKKGIYSMRSPLPPQTLSASQAQSYKGPKLTLGPHIFFGLLFFISSYFKLFVLVVFVLFVAPCCRFSFSSFALLPCYSFALIVCLCSSFMLHLCLLFHIMSMFFICVATMFMLFLCAIIVFISFLELLSCFPLHCFYVCFFSVLSLIL
jgi:hypothetical protein